MNLPQFALRYKAVIVVIVALLTVWGVGAYYTMPRREDPEYTIRTCTITAQWPGAPAEKVEELIAAPIERALSSLDEMDYVKSITTVGSTMIYFYADDSIPPEGVDNVWDKVRARVDGVAMPEPDIVPQVDDEFGATYVMLMPVYQIPLPGESQIREENRYTPRQLEVVADRIRDTLKLVPGVAKADLFGVRDEAVYIETDLGTWTQLALTMDQLQKLVEARNIVAPGGNVDTQVGRFAIKPGGELNAVQELKSVVVGGTDAPSGYTPVHLEDVGLKIVRDYEDPPASIARYGDGEKSEPCVVVAYTMKDGANVIELSKAVKKRLHEMQHVEKTIPPDLGMAYVSDQAETVGKKVNAFVENVCQAIVIVVVVAFLMVGFRSAAVMAGNIPIVILGALALVTLFGVQLEQISLASMIIALGLLVDYAVEVSDHCRVFQERGMSPKEAALKGSSMLAFPLLIATLTTVMAFLPMLHGLKGSKREYVFSLPVTLSITIGLSYVLAMTFCTLLAAWFIRPPKDPSKPESPMGWLVYLIKKLFTRGRPGGEPEHKSHGPAAWYVVLVKPCIKYRYLTIAAALALFVVALKLPVGTEFFPRDQRDQFAVEVWLPEGAGIGQTDEVTKQVEAILRKLSPTTGEQGQPAHRIRGMRTLVGGGGARWYLGRNPEAPKPNYAEILVRTTDPQFTRPMVTDLRRIARDGDKALGIDPIVEARVIPRELLMGPSIDAPIGIRISGPGFADIPKLRGLAERLKGLLHSQAGVWDVHDTWGSPGYQLWVDIDAGRANIAGVTNLDVAETLNAYFSGQQLTTYREGDHEVPIYLRLPPEQRGSLEGLHSAYVEGRSGKVPLDSIAQFGPRYLAARLERRDLNRTIEVRSRVEEGVLPNEVVEKLMASPQMKQLVADLPGGFYVEIGGMLEETTKSQKQMGAALMITVVSFILLLVIQFNDWARPIIVGATLPLALIGAFLGLYLTGNNLGFMPQLGILALFGIVVDTVLVFIDIAEMIIAEKREKGDGSGPIHGLTRDEFIDCLVDTGWHRLLPLFLTTTTTIMGLLPLALFGGPLWEAMAWCLIFGMLFSTFLEMLLVPCLYLIFTERLGMIPYKPGGGGH